MSMLELTGADYDLETGLNEAWLTAQEAVRCHYAGLNGWQVIQELIQEGYLPASWLDQQTADEMAARR